MKAPLEDILSKKIKEKNSINIAEYMDLCLYHPEFGYYRTSDPVGKKGDFITAPEISQMFGEIIGLWFSDLWNRMGKPGAVHMVEIGPGKGTLMQDLTRSISLEFCKTLHIHLVDINPNLIAEQKNRLNHLDIKWYEDIDQAFSDCQKGPVFILLNEFFDCLPVHQIIKTPKGWAERMIQYTEAEGKFVYSIEKLSVLPENINFSNPQQDQTYEISPISCSMMSQISQQISQCHGAALIIDYGYIHSAPGESLQAVRQHIYHDILKNPGLCDLTAHVNFEALALAARKQDIRVIGPTTQGNFLKELGIGIRAKALKQRATINQAFQIDEALRRLTDKDQMGNLFKVMSVISADMPTPCGFETCIPANYSAA